MGETTSKGGEGLAKDQVTRKASMCKNEKRYARNIRGLTLMARKADSRIKNLTTRTLFAINVND